MAAAASARASEDARIAAPKDTVWLVPDIDYDKQVIQKYLAAKYRDIPRDMIQVQVNMQALPHVPTMQIIVCVRRQKDEFSPLGPSNRVVFDQARQSNRHEPIPPETYIDEVFESEPVRVGEYVKVTPGMIFRPQETDLNPLIDRLCALAAPCRVTPQCKPDVMLRCVWGG